MRIQDLLLEYKALRTEQGLIVENPSAQQILNNFERWAGIRGIMAYGEFWIANAADMIHNDIARNVGLQPGEIDLFMINKVGNHYEVEVGETIEYGDLPKPVLQAIESLREGKTVYAVKNDRMLDV